MIDLGVLLIMLYLVQLSFQKAMFDKEKLLQLLTGITVSLFLFTLPFIFLVKFYISIKEIFYILLLTILIAISLIKLCKLNKIEKSVLFLLFLILSFFLTLSELTFLNLISFLLLIIFILFEIKVKKFVTTITKIITHDPLKLIIPLSFFLFLIQASYFSITYNIFTFIFFFLLLLSIVFFVISLLVFQNTSEIIEAKNQITIKSIPFLLFFIITFLLSLLIVKYDRIRIILSSLIIAFYLNSVPKKRFNLWKLIELVIIIILSVIYSL